MKILGEEDLRALVEGCTFLGCGGGGSPEQGLKIIIESLKKGLEFKMVEIDEIGDDEFLASPYFVGPVSREKYRENLALKSFEILEEYMGKKFCAVVPTELGGHNTPVALVVAAKKGIPVVDGDLAGRAVPELHHSSSYIYGYKMSPFSVAAPFGDEIIFKDVGDDEHAERIIRGIVKTLKRKVGVASHPFSAKIYRKILIRNTLSGAIRIGKILRKCRESGEDIVPEIESIGAYLLFKGDCVEVSYEEREGFSFGKLILDGIEEFCGDRYEILFKNENIVSLRNGKIDFSLPDLICVVTREGYPVTNADLSVSETYVVFGLKAPDVWRTQRGREILSLNAMEVKL